MLIAGGAVQTMQRIGAAIGIATLNTIFYLVLTRTGHGYPIAVCGFMLLMRPWHHRARTPAPHR